MNAIELINFIKRQPLISHDIPVAVNGQLVVDIELIKNEENGFIFNLIINK